MDYITDFHQAELNAAEVMRSWGYLDAVATTGGADGGIDVRSSRALAQVKWKGGAAGRPEIQNLFGARGTDTTKSLFFFAASSYTKAAIEYADYAQVALFIYDPVGAVTPSNKVAREFIQTNDGAQIVSFNWMTRFKLWVKGDGWLMFTLGGGAVVVGVLLAVIGAMG